MPRRASNGNMCRAMTALPRRLLQLWADARHLENHGDRAGCRNRSLEICLMDRGLEALVCPHLTYLFSCFLVGRPQ